MFVSYCIDHCMIFRTRLSKPKLADAHIFRFFKDVDIYSNCLIMRGCIIPTNKKVAFYFTPPTSVFVNV